MQYKLFAFFPTWLPQIPVSDVLKARASAAEETLPIDEADMVLSHISTIPFSRVGGVDAYLKSIGLTEFTNAPTDKRVLEALQNFQSVSPTIHEIETRSLMFKEASLERQLNDIEDVIVTGMRLFI
jgi:hypothetical protein